MKIKDIGDVITGFSNKVTNGSNKTSFLNISYYKTKKYSNKNTSIKKETLKKLSIKKNMVIFSPYKNINFVDLGSNHLNKTLGKNLIAIRINEKKYDVYWLYLLLKNNILNIPYEGSTIKVIKNNDILELELPNINNDILQTVEKLEQYAKLLNKQKEYVDTYLKGVIQKGVINGSDK